MDLYGENCPIYLHIWLYLKDITNNFSQTQGVIDLDDKFITSNVVDVLKRYYNEVTLLDKENIKIIYKEKR